jgi:hypothetical protein
LNQVHGLGIFEDITGGAVAQGLQHVGFVGMHGEDDNLGLGDALTDLSGYLEATHARHQHIHDEHLGTQAFDQLHSAQPIAGLANDLKPHLGFQ